MVFLLSTFVGELISTPKIITFLRVLPIGCEKNSCLSNLVPYTEYLYCSASAGCLVKLEPPNKQFYSVG